VPYLSSTKALMVALEPLTTPVGPTEVMRIVRLEPPRPPGLPLPGPRLLRLLTRFQLLRGDVNVVGAGRWSVPPLLSESHHETTNEKAKQEQPGFLGERREATNANLIPGTARARTSPPYAPYFFTLKVHLFLPTPSSVLASISTV
jgi:hypothetical protein